MWIICWEKNYWFTANIKTTIFQLGETQLKGLLERVNEQTQKTTTVKVRIFLYVLPSTPHCMVVPCMIILAAAHSWPTRIVISWVHCCIFTAHISKEWGRYCFHRCLSVHRGGGGYPSSQRGERDTPHPANWGGGTPIQLTLGGGGYPSQVSMG